MDSRPGSRLDDDDLGEVIVELLPGTDPARAVVRSGQFHDVALFPGQGAVRIARHADRQDELRRVAELCRRLDRCGLPFHVPVPLSPVIEHDSVAALAVSWVGGEPAPKGSHRPTQLAATLEALARVDLSALSDVLAPPHVYAGGTQWYALMVDEVVPRLPPRLRDEARRRIDAAAGLKTPPPGLVHGDFAGDNMRWEGEVLVGVLDWDLASAWDPAVDAACLAWHGWDTVRAAVDAATYQRACTWWATFGIEQVAAAIVAGEPPDVVDRYVAGATRWLDTAPLPS